MINTAIDNQGNLVGQWNRSAPLLSPSRQAFEDWYAVNAFDYEKNPIGSSQCSLQWKAWQAAMGYAMNATCEGKTRKTYPYKECHQNEAEIISMGKGWKKCCNDEAEIWMKE
jgi:hypothetical protein